MAALTKNAIPVSNRVIERLSDHIQIVIRASFVWTLAKTFHDYSCIL